MDYFDFSFGFHITNNSGSRITRPRLERFAELLMDAALAREGHLVIDSSLGTSSPPNGPTDIFLDFTVTNVNDADTAKELARHFIQTIWEDASDSELSKMRKELFLVIQDRVEMGIYDNSYWER